MRAFTVALALVAGCATIPTVHTSPATVAAYRAVRDGARADVAAGDMRFCAGPDAVVAERTKWRPTDDVLTRYRDYDVAERVRAALRYEPALAGAAIDVRVEQGGARLEGRVASAEAATIAIARALDTAGVVLVEARLFAPDDTRAPAAGRARWCS
jgi:osmotically-inducible protein OsmY